MNLGLAVLILAIIISLEILVFLAGLVDKVPALVVALLVTVFEGKGVTVFPLARNTVLVVRDRAPSEGPGVVRALVALDLKLLGVTTVGAHNQFIFMGLRGLQIPLRIFDKPRNGDERQQTQ